VTALPYHVGITGYSEKETTMPKTIGHETDRIWRAAKASIHPTPAVYKKYPYGLTPRMRKALDRFGWDRAATRETNVRHALCMGFRVLMG